MQRAVEYARAGEGPALVRATCIRPYSHSLSDDEKLGLSLLGEVLSDGVAYATAGELRASVKANDYPVNLSENTIRLTLEEMFRRELLEKDSADGFRIKIDLLRLWIRRSHSIWQVVKEVRTL